jgi:catechol 2,3-dioxygenase-like lactoylglutathione lyase family enzyme
LIEVERVDFVPIPTRDPDQARRFYGELLGLEESTFCHLAFRRDFDGNAQIVHRRYAP